MNTHQKLCKLLDQLQAELQLSEQCCERDHNHDGNCDRHPPCYWCGGKHKAGEVCSFAPYYTTKETKTDD